jgi:sugar diacid utilization regulator
VSLQSLADDLALALQCEVAIADHEWHIQTYSALLAVEPDPLRVASLILRATPPEARAWAIRHGVETANAPVRVPANLDIGAPNPRIVVPIRAEGILVGYLFIIEAGTQLDDEQSRLAEDTGRDAAPLLYQQRLIEGQARERQIELLSQLLEHDHLGPDEAERQLKSSGVLSGWPITVVMAICPRQETNEPLSSAQRQVLQHALERMRRSAPLGAIIGLVHHDCAVAVVCTDDQRGVSRFAATLVDALTEEGADGQFTIGVSGRMERLADAPVGRLEARAAARVAGSVGRFGSVARWEDLGVYRTLAGFLVPAADKTMWLDPHLTNLAANDPDGILIHTLETYLDHAGDAKASAELLALHRAGLYYRLTRISELTGLDLKDGEARLSLHLSIKLRRLLDPALVPD